MQNEGRVPMSGAVSLRKLSNLGNLADRKGPGLAWKLRNFIRYGYRGTAQDIASDLSGKLFGAITMRSSLSARVFRPDYANLSAEQIVKVKQLLAENVDVRELVSPFRGNIVEYGIVSRRVVTTAGVNFLASAFNNNTTNVGLFKFHGFGTGVAAEAVGDTALGTELTTQYVVDNTRPTGSQSASTNVYTTVGTLSPDSGGTIAITEHGIFSAASGVTLWDRSVFSAVNLVATADSLQVTYNLTLTAGG